MASHPRSAATHFLALEWSLALDEVCEMPEALRPTHGSQVRELRSGKFGDHWSFATNGGTVYRQPVLRLTGRVSRSNVLLKYESKWKQPFAVVNEHRQQTSDVICRIDPCLLFDKVNSTLPTEADSRWHHDVTSKFLAFHQQSTWFNVLLVSIRPHSVVLVADCMVGLSKSFFVREQDLLDTAGGDATQQRPGTLQPFLSGWVVNNLCRCRHTTKRLEPKISFCDSTHRGRADIQLMGNLTSAAVSPSFIFLGTDQLVNFLNILYRTDCGW